MPTPNAHYQATYRRRITAADKRAGFVEIKLDPYRICDVLNVGGGAREQIAKKALRWAGKGQTEREVLDEIICAAERRLEMLDEDGVA